MNNRKKILIIDDEEDILTYLSAFFKDNDYDVITAVNGKEGVSRALSEKPDVITLDISMPEESGVKALSELQNNSITNDIPIIIITGVASDFKRFISDRKQVHMPEGYFEKPIDRNLLLEKVNQLLKVT
jgi:two-component system, OmpR family, alkaline phosphatase synthesis response regulator PhoP